MFPPHRTVRHSTARHSTAASDPPLLYGAGPGAGRCRAPAGAAPGRALPPPPAPASAPRGAGPGAPRQGCPRHPPPARSRGWRQRDRGPEPSRSGPVNPSGETAGDGDSTARREAGREWGDSHLQLHTAESIFKWLLHGATSVFTSKCFFQSGGAGLIRCTNLLSEAAD